LKLPPIKLKKHGGYNLPKKTGRTFLLRVVRATLNFYYANFQLDLSNPPAVTLTEVDGLTFMGTYELYEIVRKVQSISKA
jgi:hypothetical protein